MPTNMSLGRTGPAVGQQRYRCRSVLRGTVRSAVHVAQAAPLALAPNAVQAKAGNRGALRLFLDSADVEQWRSWAQTGMLYGCTTNPSILEKDGVQCSLSSLRGLAEMALGTLGLSELQVQTWGGSTSNMVDVGRQLTTLAPAGCTGKVVVKVPITREGMEAAAVLIGEGVPVTLTGVYCAPQAFAAIAAGASYAAPYLGRMNDAGRNGLGQILDMQRMVSHSGSAMRILVASVRSAGDLVTLSSGGCDTFTISPACMAQLLDEPMTSAAAAEFERAAAVMDASVPAS